MYYLKYFYNIISYKFVCVNLPLNVLFHNTNTLQRDYVDLFYFTFVRNISDLKEKIYPLNE